MLTEPLNAIILLLSVLILVLLFVVIKINIQYYKDKKKSKKKIKFLKVHFVHTNNNKAKQIEKIKLSEELKFKWKTINSKLSFDIFELNRELFEIVSKKNLA